MKIKIIEPGFENLTGHFGVVEFKDGVSVSDVSSAEANLLSALIRVEAVDGTGVGVLDNELKQWDRPAEIIQYPTLAEIQARERAAAGGDESVATSVVNVPEVKTYTREELEAIADKGGIAAVREIAERFDVKSTSIVKLIEGIVAAQTPAVEAKE